MNEKEIDNAIVDASVYQDDARYHALFRRLRADCPVRWTAPDGYDPFWTVSRYEDIVKVQTQPSLFLSGGRTILAPANVEKAISSHREVDETLQNNIIQINGDEHTSVRNVTREWFLPRNIAKLEESIAGIAREYISNMVSLGGACDFVQDVAAWFPLRTIMAIFGMSKDDAPTLFRLSKERTGGEDPEFQRSGDRAEHTVEVLQDFYAIFGGIMNERRRHPADDLASVIANAEIAGKPLTKSQVFSYYQTITIAGHDTTTASIAGGLLALIRYPDQMAKLRADLSLIPTAVGEMIRWTAPVRHFFRTAVEDYELAGQAIKAGDTLLMCYPSACRDETIFDNPFEFRVDRKPNRHLAFGIGPHNCLGQVLARTEMEVFYREFLARITDISLNGEPENTRTTFMGGLKRLPICYRVAS
ncbi:MAG: cytochrome P450 [Rhizomicrobium sp.]